MIYDTIIIGRGPAGISCGVYLKRFNLNPLIIAYDNGALKDAHFIDNYYGVSHLSGNDLALSGIRQAKELGVSMVDAEVISIEMLDHFYVKTTSGDYEAKTLFLAMGKKRNTLKIKSANLFDGHGVSYCAICDGFFFKNKKIGLAGAGPFMESEYNVLKNFSKDITIFTEGEETKINANIISIIFIYISISANHANNFKAITIVLKSHPIKISQQIKFYLFCITSFSNSFNSS